MVDVKVINTWPPEITILITVTEVSGATKTIGRSTSSFYEATPGEAAARMLRALAHELEIEEEEENQ